MSSRLDERELERALLYLEDQDAGFAIAEVNEAALERRAMDHFLERLPDGECAVIDLKKIPPETRPAAFIHESVANAPETRAFFILNLQAAAGEGPEARERMARELNFGRDVLARLDRLLFFFFPTWFVDLLIRHAKDFFDFVPVVFPLKAETEETAVTAWAAETPPVDKEICRKTDTGIPGSAELYSSLGSGRVPIRRVKLGAPGDALFCKSPKTYLENRIAFLKETLASGEMSAEEAAKTHEDLGDCYEPLSELESALAHFRKARTKAKNDKMEANLDLKIGRIYTTWGRLDEAMALFQRSLAVYENLEDSRSRAVTMGYIARILENKGEVEDALKLHYQRMKVFEALGDRREKAVTMGDIGRILTNKGEVEEALKLLQEALEIYEALGDRRSKAITMGDIAYILEDKGEVDEALKLHAERLEVFEALGDRRERAVTLWDIGRIQKMRGDINAALRHIGESYQIAAQLDDAGGLTIAGQVFGQMLLEDGDTENGMAVLKRSRDMYRKLGQPEKARQVEGIIARFS